MFPNSEDNVSHKDRWETYILPFPTSTTKKSKATPTHAAEKTPTKQTPALASYLSSMYQNPSPASFEVQSAADEQDALMAKASFAPSPYVHFAKDTKKKKLGLYALVVLIFYEVSGGPFGIEDVVRAGVRLINYALF